MKCLQFAYLHSGFPNKLLMVKDQFSAAKQIGVLYCQSDASICLCGVALCEFFDYLRLPFLLTDTTYPYVKNRLFSGNDVTVQSTVHKPLGLVYFVVSQNIFF